MNYKKLHRWYKEILSGFTEEATQKQLHQYDLYGQKAGKEAIIPVPILRPEHLGEHMAIDEKQVGEEFYTILSNRTTGKIALAAQTLRSSDLMQLMQPFNLKHYSVKSITRDLAPNYDWFCRQAFPNAMHVADKFHVVRLLIEAVQDVRIRYRQELLSERRKAYEEHKKHEKQKQLKAERQQSPYAPKKFSFREKKLSNGDTRLELLARSHYLLYKLPEHMTQSQKARAAILFEDYPQIKSAHGLATQFRYWYIKDSIGKPLAELMPQLLQWYANVEQADITELLNFKSTVESNQGVIINYFHKGFTNAKAERLNKEIQRFITSNQGTRNLDFFFFRLTLYFASTSI
jgi:transposase